jgi:hypothetical protein
MYFTPEQLRTLEDGYYTVSRKYHELLSQYIAFSNAQPQTSEYILHGFIRRLGTLQRCIQNGNYSPLPLRQLASHTG